MRKSVEQYFSNSEKKFVILQTSFDIEQPGTLYI